jgi:hypothetical protein
MGILLARQHSTRRRKEEGVKAVVTEGPVLVVKQEGDFASLPGIEEFVRDMKADLKTAREKNAEARVKSWDVIRRCYEYGQRPDVQARVQALNLLPNGKKKEGRPHSGHTLALEAIAAKSGVTKRTLQNWQVKWLDAAAKLGVEPGCPAQELNETFHLTPAVLADWLDKFDEKDAPEPADDKSKQTFKDLLHSFHGRMESLGEKVGEVALRNKRNQEAWADAMEAWWQARGVKAEITFKG